MCVYTFLWENFYSRGKAKRERLKKNCLGFYRTLNFFLEEPTKMEKKVRTNERTKERHVSGQEMRIFGGRVCFKKAEKTDVLGRSE